MKYTRAGHLLRWFLLVWLGLMYLWGLQLIGLFFGGGALPTGALPSEASVPPGQGTAGSTCASLSPSLFTVLLFTGLMVGQASLYWLGLSGTISRRWRLLYLAIQGLLVGLISFSLYLGCVTPALPEDFLICLYLALIVGAISILNSTRAIIGVVIGYLILLVVNTVVLAQRSSLHVAFLVSPQPSVWYAAMILFVVGYIIVYLHQLHMHSQLQVTHARLKASATRIEELTKACERERLARDLHDTLAQGLAGVTMQLEAANTHLAHQHVATAQAVVQQAMLCAREALIDARRAIDDLRTQQTGTADTAVALRKEVDRFAMAAGIPCTVDIAQNLAVSPLVSEHLVGIVREGLTNITRHAQAHQVQLSLAPRGKTLLLDIDDDGVGFDPAAATQSGHYGLIGVRERVRLLGGTLTIRSVPGRGTCLQVCLPGKQEAWELSEASPARHEQETEREDLHV